MKKPRIENLQYVNGFRTRGNAPLMGAESVDFIEKTAYDRAVEALKSIEKIGGTAGAVAEMALIELGEIEE